jgi:hypothetical protein
MVPQRIQNRYQFDKSFKSRKFAVGDTIIQTGILQEVKPGVRLGSLE